MVDWASMMMTASEGQVSDRCECGTTKFGRLMSQNLRFNLHCIGVAYQNSTLTLFEWLGVQEISLHHDRFNWCCVWRNALMCSGIMMKLVWSLAQSC
jgi:hypothetical protein